MRRVNEAHGKPVGKLMDKVVQGHGRGGVGFAETARDELVKLNYEEPEIDALFIADLLAEHLPKRELERIRKRFVQFNRDRAAEAEAEKLRERAAKSAKASARQERERTRKRAAQEAEGDQHAAAVQKLIEAGVTPQQLLDMDDEKLRELAG